MAASIFFVIHVLVSVAIVGLVLIQQGKGADMGAAFGGGSQTLFGARGAGNFLTRVTAILATVFFFTSGSLAYLYSQREGPTSVTATPAQEQVQDKQEKDTPAKQADNKPADKAPAAPATEGGTSGTGEVPQAPGQADPKTSSGEIPAAPASK